MSGTTCEILFLKLKYVLCRRGELMSTDNEVGINKTNASQQKRWWRHPINRLTQAFWKCLRVNLLRNERAKQVHLHLGQEYCQVARQIILFLILQDFYKTNVSRWLFICLFSRKRSENHLHLLVRKKITLQFLLNVGKMYANGSLPESIIFSL